MFTVDPAPEQKGPPELTMRSETYMSSREWLNKHGLRPKKLGFYDIMASVAFKHQDGVVDVKHAPHQEIQTDAVSEGWVEGGRVLVLWEGRGRREGSGPLLHITKYRRTLQAFRCFFGDLKVFGSGPATWDNST